MAAAFFNLLAEKKGVALRAESAGIAPFEEGASYEAVQAAADYGADLSSHRTRQLDQAGLHGVERVITMTETHKQRLEQDFALASGLVFTLMESVRGSGDIYDPYLKPLTVYRNCAAQIWAAVGKLVDRLAKEATDIHGLPVPKGP
jgi:protein-tyrosine-phosphatase